MIVSITVNHCQLYQLSNAILGFWKQDLSRQKNVVKPPVRVGKGKLKLPNVSCESLVTFHGRCMVSCHEFSKIIFVSQRVKTVKHVYSISYSATIIFECSFYFFIFINKNILRKIKNFSFSVITGNKKKEMFPAKRTKCPEPAN